MALIHLPLRFSNQVKAERIIGEFFSTCQPKTPALGGCIWLIPTAFCHSRERGNPGAWRRGWSVPSITHGHCEEAKPTRQSPSTAEDSLITIHHQTLHPLNNPRSHITHRHRPRKREPVAGNLLIRNIPSRPFLHAFPERGYINGPVQSYCVSTRFHFGIPFPVLPRWGFSYTQNPKIM
jgi:hypothetical protein